MLVFWSGKEGHFTVLELAWQFRGKSSELLELFHPDGFTTIRSHNTAALLFTKTSSLLEYDALWIGEYLYTFIDEFDCSIFSVQAVRDDWATRTVKTEEVKPSKTLTIY